MATGRLTAGHKLALLGAAYKADIDDARESPAGLLASVAKRRGIEVSVHDPLVTAGNHHGLLVTNDLVNRRVAVIFSASTAATVLAAKAATDEIPIVFSMGADPVGIGAVASFARPGGNITGITVLAGELIGKRFELLHEIVPTAATVAYLVNTANPAFSEAALKMRTERARTLGLRLLIVNASSPNDIDRAFTSLVAEKAGALLVGPDTLFQTQREQIVALAARYRVQQSTRIVLIGV
jgi:ABC-type uncharacterized transport system substrate-binding protein